MNIFMVLIDNIKKLDNKTKKLMHIGYIFSFILCLISCLSLLVYEILYPIPELFYCGISLFKTSLIFGCSFFMFGLGFDTIKKEIT